MSTIFHFNDDEINDDQDLNVDIDDLYEKNKELELRKIQIYNKILLKNTQ